MNDTHPEAQRVQIELLRAMTAARRAALASSLTDQVVALSKRAIARAHPGKSAQERSLFFITVHYGHSLAERVRAYLLGRRNDRDIAGKP